MSQNLIPPRSTLHSLPPMYLGTAEVESLTSYICRLACSHSMSVQHLVEWMLNYFGQQNDTKFTWHLRNFSSASVESERWADRLSQLSGVAELDRLTLSPWRHLVGMPGMAPKSDQWCPCCLAQDKTEKREPYFRLAWEVASVTVCHQHRVDLVSSCPQCKKSNTRNRASIVVPGYCTSCGGFLGDAVTGPAPPEALWIARQVGLMLAARPQVNAENVIGLLKTVIERMADNNVSAFAKKYGFSKSGVWHWLNKGGVPSMRAWLTIALYGGISIEQLFAGDVDSWVVPESSPQIPISLPTSPRAGIKSRELDWEEIKEQLRVLLERPLPVSINEACSLLGVDRKHVYLRANAEARAITVRHSKYREGLRRQKEQLLETKILDLLQERIAAGSSGISARDVWERLDEEARSVESIYTIINRVIARRTS